MYIQLEIRKGSLYIPYYIIQQGLPYCGSFNLHKNYKHILFFHCNQCRVDTTASAIVFLIIAYNLHCFTSMVTHTPGISLSRPKLCTWIGGKIIALGHGVYAKNVNLFYAIESFCIKKVQTIVQKGKISLFNATLGSGGGKIFL